MILVTGAAGFIGAHVAAALADKGYSVIGCDNLNNYYDPALKQARVKHFLEPRNVKFEAIDLTNSEAVKTLFNTYSFEKVIHLAAQAGVRHSLSKPEEYLQSNVVGFGHLLEACRLAKINHLIYASSSSVYGASTAHAFVETQDTSTPQSLYAATKKSNELMAHAYAYIYGLPCTGLRFFSVYGPWGRPDMAYYHFTQKILQGESIPLFDDGELARDFTYIDDVVNAVVQITAAESPDLTIPYKIYNIGNNQPVKVIEMVRLIEAACQRTAITHNLPKPNCDVLSTCANIDAMKKDYDWSPTTPMPIGIQNFVNWFKAFYGK